MKQNSTVVSEPRLGSFWLELFAKKLGSARSLYLKARLEKFSKNEPKPTQELENFF